MRKMKMLTLFIVVALLACQASAVDPNGVATWNEETVTVTSPTYATPSFSAGALNEYVNAIRIDTTGNTAEVTIRKAGPEFIANGSFENPFYRTYNPQAPGQNKYMVALAGDVWRHWQINSNQSSTKFYWPDGVLKSWTKGNGSAIAFPDGAPDGDNIVYVYTRYDANYDNGGLYLGYPDYHPRTMEAVCQMLPQVRFDPTVPISLSAMVGKFPVEGYNWNGYALQIAVGGSADYARGNYSSDIQGGTVIAELLVDPNNGPAENAWESATVTYDASDPLNFKQYAGQPIQVRLAVYEDTSDPNFAITSAAAFDDVTVTVGGETLMGDVVDPVVSVFAAQYGVNPDITNITVYDDECDMSRGLGILAGDINKDCAVNLLDLTELAGSWLALPASTPLDIP